MADTLSWARREARDILLSFGLPARVTVCKGRHGTALLVRTRELALLPDKIGSYPVISSLDNSSCSSEYKYK